MARFPAERNWRNRPVCQLLGPSRHLSAVRYQLPAPRSPAVSYQRSAFSCNAWKDADSDIPLYQPAKADYAKLQ